MTKLSKLSSDLKGSTAAPARPDDSTNNKVDSAPKRHLIDRRAAQVISTTDAGDGDRLLSTRELAELLGMSEQWCETSRHRGVGPKFVRLSPRCIRYKKADVLAWLEERATHRCTGEYTRKVREVA